MKISDLISSLEIIMKYTGNIDLVEDAYIDLACIAGPLPYLSVSHEDILALSILGVTMYTYRMGSDDPKDHVVYFGII